MCANILLDADGSRPLGRTIYYHDVEIGVGLHSCGDTHWIDQSIGLHDVLCFLTSHVKERLEHISGENTEHPGVVGSDGETVNRSGWSVQEIAGGQQQFLTVDPQPDSAR